MSPPIGRAIKADSDGRERSKRGNDRARSARPREVQLREDDRRRGRWEMVIQLSIELDQIVATCRRTEDVCRDYREIRSVFQLVNNCSASSRNRMLSSVTCQDLVRSRFLPTAVVGRAASEVVSSRPVVPLRAHQAGRGSHSGRLAPRGTSTSRNLPGVLDITTWSVTPW